MQHTGSWIKAYKEVMWRSSKRKKERKVDSTLNDILDSSTTGFQFPLSTVIVMGPLQRHEKVSSDFWHLWWNIEDSRIESKETSDREK